MHSCRIRDPAFVARCSSHSRACQLVHRLCWGSHSGHPTSRGTVPRSSPQQVQGQPSVTEQRCSYSVVYMSSIEDFGGRSIWYVPVSWEASKARLEQKFFHSTPVPRKRPCRKVLVSLLQPRPQTPAVHGPVGPVYRGAVGRQDARSNGAKKMRSCVGRFGVAFCTRCSSGASLLSCPPRALERRCARCARCADVPPSWPWRRDCLLGLLGSRPSVKCLGESVYR